MIVYKNTLDELKSDNLQGFFVGWGSPLTPEKHLQVLAGSSHVWLAINDENGQVVGFINAISDGVLSAFIPLLEVLPTYQDKGIGTELARRMMETLRDFYSIDLICDPDVQPFYERLGMMPYSGMIYRNHG